MSSSSSPIPSGSNDIDITYQRHMDEGSANLLNLSFDAAIECFDLAVALQPSSLPKQWMRGIALFFCQRYEEGSHQFVTNKKVENPNDVEEVVWACMCNMKRLGIETARRLLLPCPTKDSRIPMREIYNLFSGRSNISDVLHAAATACNVIDNNDPTCPNAYAHLYIALYLDCIISQQEGIGLSEASRRHYIIAGNKPSKDFMGKLSTSLCKYILDNENTNTTSTINTMKSSRQSIRQTIPTSSSSYYSYSSSLVGCWQLSGGHHYNDSPTKEELHRRLTANIDNNGFTTLDMGDIYTGVEESVGIYVSENPNTASMLQIHTKLVPDLHLLSNWSTERHTTNIIRRSINRLRYFQKLHLVQFHWWDWDAGDHVEAYRGLCSLMPSMIQSVGVTNYDTEHLMELLDARLRVYSNQVQYSLIDRRVETTNMIDVCTKNNIRLLCYGCLAGGFLSDRWLGKEDPVPSSIVVNSNCSNFIESLSNYLTNRSLIKYYLVIREFGGWSLFQELLVAIRKVADRHQRELSEKCNIATVAQAWVLFRRRVGGIIIGLSGNDSHLHCASNAHRLAHLLDENDETILKQVLDKNQGPTGPFYSIERIRDGPHGRIMRYNCGELFTKTHAEEFVRRVHDLISSEESSPPPETWLLESMLLESRGFDKEVQKHMLVKSIEALKNKLVEVA